MTTGTKEVKIINKKGVVVVNRIHKYETYHDTIPDKDHISENTFASVLSSLKVGKT